jgi:hypothetical protein
LPRNDLYRAFHRHRLALAVADPNATADPLRQAIAEIAQYGPSFYTDFLPRQGLSSYWHHALERHSLADAIEPVARAALKQARIAEAVSYMAQKAALRELDRLFEAKGIRYAVIKGAHVRELVYVDPALRPASDIDLLIAPEQLLAAVDALKGAGFTLFVNPDIVSHEASLARGGVDIDLHWDILRPGRTRIDTVNILLARRRRSAEIWGLDDADAVFLMLVHPAFAKYVCSPNMDLNKVIDFTLWATRRTIDWDAVAALLEQTGLCTAAWTVLRWYAMLLEPGLLPVSDDFVARIAPGPLRQRYLARWLERDLPARWLDRPARIQFGFTLFLHDRPSDAWHALISILRARRRQGDDPLPGIGQQPHNAGHRKSR